MDNFEARYRAIVEKQPGLRHHLIGLDGDKFYVDGGAPIWPEIARSAVCWWLEVKLPDDWTLRMEGGASQILVWDDAIDEWVVVSGFTDPADAILTAWEIILGIKEAMDGK